MSGEQGLLLRCGVIEKVLGGRVVKLRSGSDYYYCFTGVVFTTVKALLLFLFRAVWLRLHPYYFYLGVANAACCCCSGERIYV